RAQIEQEWNEFDGVISGLDMPFFYTVGNHDLSNTTMRSIWEERYGPRYYHFVYKNVLFLVLDNEEFSDEGLAQRQAQSLAIIADFQRYFAELAKSQADGAAPPEMPKIDHSVALDYTQDAEFSEQQIAYMENAIAQNPGVSWTFLFLHKPV